MMIIGRGRRRGTASLQRRDPVAATYRLIQNEIDAARAIPAPKGCTRKALARFPEDASLTAVVMPQVAQGFPSVSAKAQGGRPSCVCVP